MTESYVVKIDRGQAKLYNTRTKGFKTATSPVYKATHAVIMGDEVHVTCADGRVRIFDFHGHLKSIV